LPRFSKEWDDVKTFFEQWVFIIKHLHELDDVPENLRQDEVFEQLFEIAKIAKMTKKEVINYLKDLNDMNIVKNEIRTRDNIIAQRDNIIAAERKAHQETRNVMAQIIAQKDKALLKANARIAELERRKDLN